MGLFIKKPLSLLQAEAAANGSHSLRRILGPIGLIAFGVGVIIGAGLFSITGAVAAEYTGPAISLSFAIAAIGCAFAGLCYAEFASMIPVSGSAYTYSYATMGELIAWIIGWDLVLEYTVAAVTVSISWSQYFAKFMADCGLPLPVEFTACPWDGGIVNIPAALIVVLMSLFLIGGTKESSRLNTLIVFLKVSVIVIFIALGWRYVKSENLTPFIPQNTGVLGEYGWSGVLRGAAVVFFAFLGFDAVSTAAQETTNPKRNMPLGILCSLLICTILYVAFGYIMTGVAHYTEFAGAQGLAPVSIAISHMGTPGNNQYLWLNQAVTMAILFGYCSVILVQLMAQSRIFMTMSADGLLPQVFSHISPRFRTPVYNNLIFMMVIASLAAVVPARLAGEMTSIGTLFAFSLVCAGVLVVRKTMPHVPRTFRTPLVPFIPVAGILVCVSLMLFLPADTWIRLVIWMLLGFDVYSSYGVRHSHMESGLVKRRRGLTILHTLSIAMGALCIVTGFWHQQSVGWGTDKTMFVIAVVFGLFHIMLYTYRLWKTVRPAPCREA